MARITASVYTSHVPAIGAAMDLGKTTEPYWQPLFKGYEPSRQWLKDNTPDSGWDARASALLNVQAVLSGDLLFEHAVPVCTTGSPIAACSLKRYVVGTVARLKKLATWSSWSANAMRWMTRSARSRWPIWPPAPTCGCTAPM